MVSFVATEAGLLIVVEGCQTLSAALVRVRHTRPVRLVYTVPEWDAFLRGVRNHEFDDLLEGSARDYMPLRDSKDPDGPVLLFMVAQMRSFFSALLQAKYNLP